MEMKAVGHKNHEPTVVPNNLRERNLPGKKNTKARYKQGEDKARIQRAPLFHRNGAAYCVSPRY